MGHLDLSFVTKRGRGPNRFQSCWDVKNTGDYGRDCDKGRLLALEYLAYEEAEESGIGNSLFMIVRNMPRGGEMGGIEVGFLTMVAYAAGAGAERSREIAAYWERCARDAAGGKTAA